MNIDEFTLAATTNDLTREPEAREIADAIEFRMDSAKDPIKQLSEYQGSLPIIATNRTYWFGGEATDAGRLDRTFAASRFESVETVDIELETARSKDWILDELRENDVDLIVSHHDFDGTPNEEILDAIIKQCAEYGDIAKVATFPQTHSDVLKLLNSVNNATEQGINVGGISMGEIGSHTRIIGPLYGSKLGYAPLVSDTSEYAPGQIPLKELAKKIETVEQGGKPMDLAEKTPKAHSEQQESIQIN